MASDYTVGDTIYKTFTTRSFSTGAPTQLAGTPVVSAYEDDGLTQITAGITLGVDHDSVTGLNLLTIAASGANGYESGKDYNLVITTGTVGGVSVVGETVVSFSLGRSAAAVDLANGTDGLGAIKGDTASTKTKTDFLPSATAGAAGGVFIAGTNAATTVTTSFTTTFTGSLTGSVASVTGNVGGSVASVTAINTTGGAIDNVTTVAINDDMRGTDNALLAANAPANFSDLSISVTTGLVDITQAAADKAWSTAARTITAATNITSDSSAITMSSSGVVGTVNTVTNGVTVGTNNDKTGYSIAGVINTLDGLENISVVDILTEQMTESYAADGVAPTLTEALMLIQQALTEFAFAGTSNTVKQLNGSATAAVMTLDDGTNPTSSTRTS